MLSDRLREASLRSFVGRDRELGLFAGALETGGVLFVHGAGGLGKSLLLEAFAQAAAEAGRMVQRIDGRHLALGPQALPSLLAGPGLVLLIDTYELLEPLDDFVREGYLGSLPEDAVVVIAGRQPPAPRWRADPGWRSVMREIPLKNLSPEQGRAYLVAQGVPADGQGRLLELSHGHPLTLSMLVDAVRRGTLPHTLGDVPDLINELLASVVDTVPSPVHREALEVCAYAPTTTESLLRGVLGDRGSEMFAWLRSVPFMNEGPHGLYPHDVVRDALDADLRWRDPLRYNDLGRRVGEAMLAQLHTLPSERDRIQLLVDRIVLSAARSREASCTAPSPALQAYVDELRAGDRDGILAMTEAWQGPEQAGLTALWLDRRPQSFRVFRSVSGEPRGYTAALELSEEDLGLDPGVDEMWRHVSENGPLRSGEKALAWRFFVDRDLGQQSSPSATLFAACQVLRILTSNDIAWTLVGAYADADVWGPSMKNLDHWPSTEYQVASEQFPVFAHDWRRVDVREWRERLHGRNLGGALTNIADARQVLSEAEFGAAVRAGLRQLGDADELRKNPLLSSRLVREQSSGQQGSEHVLRKLLEEAISMLEPRSRELAERTFLHPNTTQEQIAQSLYLSFNTFRRHRDRAVNEVVARLWVRETGGHRSPPARGSDRHP